MADPQGIIYFTGIRSLMSGSFTLSHGVSPSTCTLYIPPQAGVLPTIGTLELHYGAGRVVFPDCKIVNCDFETSSDGRTVWALTIQDTRWRWKRGRISGEYNLRRADGEPRPGTIKKPRELLALLFAAIGVTRYNISEVPNDTFPERIWEYHQADSELARLVEELGCRVTLGPGNAVKVCRSGIGKPLPLGADVLDNSLSLLPADRPDVLRFVGGRSLWMPPLELEALGREPNGSLVPIDKLSYKPVDGWKTFKPFCNDVAAEFRELAMGSVFKIYRPWEPFKVAGEDLTLERILPITDKQVTTHEVDGIEEANPAVVFGRWCPGHANPVNNTAAVAAVVKGEPQYIFHRGFQLDTERAIVEFDEPVYATRWNEPTRGYFAEPAFLFLRTGFGVRDKDTRAWRHFELDLQIPGPKTGQMPEHIVHEDVVAKEWPVFAGIELIKVENNWDEVKQQATHYLQAALATWQHKTPGTITYAGFKNIAPDGAIQQVSWTVSENGEARTRASRNRDEPTPGGTFAERRFQEKVIALLGEPAPAFDPRKKVRR